MFQAVVIAKPATTAVLLPGRSGRSAWARGTAAGAQPLDTGRVAISR
ncbi:hypothetical protein [Microbacterium sp.]